MKHFAVHEAKALTGFISTGLPPEDCLRGAVAGCVFYKKALFPIRVDNYPQGIVLTL